eukprot:TRINITY_DN9780_c0_g1_i1.p1 TRINITY_DN9780_c0_g1~~TRINITY_DN9780_c0_g1_i1.p1  ORF type:complete len:248 (-),score=41.07 TRINITY_DN9780_c0_g1_i1:39-782(-)
MSYSEAGVDTEKSESLIDSIRSMVRGTQTPGCSAELGGFGSIFDLKSIKLNDPLLVSSTDGVGSKLEIARLANKHNTIGIDLVAMCVNDIFVHGAQPLFFLDYFATGKLEVMQAREVIEGICKACQECGCALSGGETAEMPGMYKVGDYDLAGFTVGVVERENLLPKISLIKEGDILIGLASSGVHSNGFSLIRHVMKNLGVSYDSIVPETNDQTFFDILLTPTKLYTSVVNLAKMKLIKGAAHITG